jgi:hypothetical protein
MNSLEWDWAGTRHALIRIYNKIVFMYHAFHKAKNVPFTAQIATVYGEKKH